MAKKTHNSYFDDKVILRLNNLPEKKHLNVLDCYAYEGNIWNEIKNRAGKDITVTGLEITKTKKINIKTDNIKFLESVEIDRYDIIDLDAFGQPIEQLEIIKEKKWQGTIFITFIQTGMGNLNKKLLTTYGYSEEMLKKCQTIFTANGFDKLFFYLTTTFNFDKIIYKHDNKKYYICLTIKNTH